MLKLARRPLLLCLLIATAAMADDEGGKIRIDSPRRDAVVTTPAIYVSGTLEAKSCNVGVAVNDIPALLDLDHAGTKKDPFRWFASVDAAAGRVKLKARIRRPQSGGDDDENDDDDDERASSVIHVQHVPPARPVTLRPIPESGLVPLEVEFTVRTDITDITRFEIDYEGDGVFDRSETSIPDELRFTYQTPGLRQATIRLTRVDGGVAIDTTAVAPQSFTTMNALLQGIWKDFGDALARRDIGEASRWLAPDAAEKYRGKLELIRANLPRFAAGIRTMQAVSIVGNVAEYLVTRDEDGQTHGYRVYFARHEGLWKIVQF